MEPDVQLTFDEKSFTTAINAIINRLTAMEDATKNVGKSVDKAAGMMTGAMLKASAIIGIVVSTTKKLLSHIPEIGKSFHIAGDIIMQNLLWPLRKELIPILQKMLNWVRDHRAMFVQWGSVLANVFRALKTLVVGMFEMLSSFWTKISGSIERIFGVTLKSVSETLNVLLFKITAAGIFIITMIGNIMDVLAETLKGIEPSLKGIIDSFKRMGEVIFGNVESVGLLSVAFSDLKALLQVIAYTLFPLIDEALDNLATGIEKVALTMKSIQTGNLVNYFKELTRMEIEHQKRKEKRSKDWEEKITEVTMKNVIETGGLPKAEEYTGIGSGSRIAPVKEEIRKFRTVEEMKKFRTVEEMKKFRTVEEMKKFRTVEEMKKFRTVEEVKKIKIEEETKKDIKKLSEFKFGVPMSSVLSPLSPMIKAGAPVSKTLNDNKTFNMPTTLNIYTQPGANATDISRETVNAIHNTLKSITEKQGGGFTTPDALKEFYKLGR